MKAKKPKPGFMDCYKRRYNPETEGYGSPDQWKSSYRIRMGLPEAKTIIGDENVYSILELSENCTAKDIKKAYRRLAMKWHPDKHQTVEAKKEAETMFKKITAAYVVLTENTAND